MYGLVKATFTEVGKRRQTGISPRGTAGCMGKGIGKRVHWHYPNPSMKTYFLGLTRAKMLKELLAVKGRSGQPWHCMVPAGR